MLKHSDLNWTDVDSSNVSSVGYHPDTKTLAVKFHNGGLYGYQGVDNEHYVEMVHSESVGKYLNRVIKVLYPYTKFNDESELLAAIAA